MIMSKKSADKKSFPNLPSRARHPILALLLALLAGFLLLPVQSVAQLEGSEEQATDKRFVTIDFDNVDIAVFIKYMSELTGKNFVIDETVRGKVTIISPSKISVDEAFKVFESVLEVHGYTTIPAGSIIKIIPAVDARTKNIETLLQEAATHPNDKVVTRLIPLKYASTEELKKIFTPLVSKNSIVVSYDPTKTLIITDVQSNINRLLKIIEAIDLPVADMQLEVLPLRFASAEEVAKSILTLFQGTAVTPESPAASGVKIVPDTRTNVLVIQSSPEKMAQIKELVARLDREIPRGEGDIRVYYLENANAEELAKVLTTLPGKDATAAPQGAEKAVLPSLGKDIKIVADKATNSLVITAPKDDYLVLEEVIRKLDIPRKMVYLEALIMEVGMQKNFELGFEWTSPGSFNDKRYGYMGAFQGEFGLPKTYPGDIPSGLSLGIMGESISIGGVAFASLKAVFKAFKNDSDVNIISAPQILTTDNEEAQIKVGDNIPYQTRDAAANETAYTNYEYRDVGTTLKITPQINQEGVVRLKVFQQIIDIVSDPDPAAKFRPRTQTRSAETTVIVKDRHTVVIGGIILDKRQDTQNQVPGLGDIPILGWAFKTKSDRSDKKNLFLFITPHIVSNPTESSRVFESKRDIIEDITQGPSPILQKMTGETDAAPLLDQGLELYRAGELVKAKRSFQRALLVDPQSPKALFYLAQLHEWEGDLDEAVRLYERLAELDAERAAEVSTEPAHGGATFSELGAKRLNELGR